MGLETTSLRSGPPVGPAEYRTSGADGRPFRPPLPASPLAIGAAVSKALSALPLGSEQDLLRWLAEVVVWMAGSPGGRQVNDDWPQVAQLSSFLPAATERSALPSTMPAPGQTAVFCLGEFKLSLDGVPVRQWRAGKARALFQYLVNHANRPIPRDELIATLWPAPEAVAAATSLKVAVHALRQTLSQASRKQTSLAVLAHDAGYMLSTSNLWFDVTQFERCYALGRRLEATGRAAEAQEAYARAAELYRGDLLAESWDDWVIFRREALKDKCLFVLARLAEMALVADDYQECILRCQQVLAMDPCREDTYRMLMLCHARLGQRDRVRRWYALCVRTLRTELDVAPEPETEALLQRSLRPGGPGACMALEGAGRSCHASSAHDCD